MHISGFQPTPNNATVKETISKNRMVMLTDMGAKSLKNRWRYHPCLAIRKERRSSLCSILIELIVGKRLMLEALGHDEVVDPKR